MAEQIAPNSAGDRLRSFWSSLGLVLQGGVLESTINDFERRNHIIFPEDMRGYFAVIDGMSPFVPNDQDPEGFSFWPIQRVKSVREEARNHLKHSWLEFPEAGSLFLFADYLTWCWGYAIHLSNEPISNSSVYIIGKAETPVKISDSFSAFVDLYLMNSSELYGPDSS